MLTAVGGLRRGPARRPAAAAAGAAARAAGRRRPPAAATAPRRSGGAAASRRGRCSRTSGWPWPSGAAGGCRPTSSSACSGATARTPRAVPACCAWAGRSPRGCSSCSPSCARASTRRAAPGIDDPLPGLAVPPELLDLLEAQPRRRRRRRSSAACAPARTTSPTAPCSSTSSPGAHRRAASGGRRRSARPTDLPYSIAGMCHSLAELAATRADMLEELGDLMAETALAADPAPARRAGVRRRARRARRGRRPAAPAELEPVAVGRRHVPPRRRARRRHGDRPEVRRPAPADRDRRRHARHRPRPAAARRPGHGQDVGQRAPRRGDQRRLHAARAGHRRHDRGVAALRLELRPPARRGPDRGRARAEPGVPGDAHRARSSASRS